MQMFTGYFTYGVASSKITFKSISQIRADQFVKCYWKIKDTTTGDLLYGGWTTNGQVTGIIGHNYSIAVLNYDNTYATVNPSSFKLTGNINIVAKGKAEPTQTTCQISITCSTPLWMTCRDSANLKQTSATKVTSWTVAVACGSVTVGAVDDANNWANIIPSATQNVVSGTIAQFVATPKVQQPIPQTCANVPTCGTGCISLCGNTPTSWNIHSYDGALNFSGSGTTGQYPNVPPGMYYITFLGAGTVTATPNPFEVISYRQTSVVFTYSDAGQTQQASQTSYIPSYYSPSGALSATTDTVADTSSLSYLWANYEGYILIGGGIVAFITWLAVSRKKK